MKDDEERQSFPDDVSSAAIPSSRGLGGGEKWKAGGGGNKKNHALTQPLKTPRKSLSGNSKDSNDNNGYSFLGHLMSYILYQNRVESEQRDHQTVDSDYREREYELCCEELALKQEENCVQ